MVSDIRFTPRILLVKRYLSILARFPSEYTYPIVSSYA
jgi:hypothetical protein